MTRDELCINKQIVVWVKQEEKCLDNNTIMRQSTSVHGCPIHPSRAHGASPRLVNTARVWTGHNTQNGRTLKHQQDTMQEILMLSELWRKNQSVKESCVSSER